MGSQPYVAVYVLQCLSGVGDRQVCVQDEPQSTGSLVVMKAILAGLKRQEAVLPGDRQTAKDYFVDWITAVEDKPASSIFLTVYLLALASVC